MFAALPKMNRSIVYPLSCVTTCRQLLDLVEIERCVEREKTYELSEQNRFFELLKYIFAVDVDGEANQFVLRKSSLLTLIDIN